MFSDGLYVVVNMSHKYRKYVYTICMLPTATFVGGGFIVGLTEAVYTPTMGLTWAVMPLTAALSFIVGKTLLQFFLTMILIYDNKNILY